MRQLDKPLLLLQIRNDDDPIVAQEVRCFGEAVGPDAPPIVTHSLLAGPPSSAQLRDASVVMIGGSGDYSVVEGGPWLAGALEAMRTLVRKGKPTFASCWGFQAMARALGGEVVTSVEHAELGTLEVHLTDEGRADPLTAELPASFLACQGHQDMVRQLPPGAVRLARSDQAPNQSFRIAGKPIYATQFHPELRRAAFVERVGAYPQYLRGVTGESFEEFYSRCVDTPHANTLIRRFLLQLRQRA